MKKQLLFILMIALSIHSYAQTHFEAGYFINNQGEKKNVLIENLDWQRNPTQFTYKLDENSPRETASIENVQEFSFNNTKFQRFKVQRDISTNDVNSLGLDKRPKFLEEPIFLKVLIEGEASLYSFTDQNRTLYFYDVKGKDEVEQLVYKKYRPQPSQVAENNRFRQQLWLDVKCGDISMTEVMRLDYYKDDLLEFFRNYNQCKNSEYTSYVKEKEPTKFDFNLNIRPGLRYATLYVDSDRRSADVGPALSFRVGAEFEFVLPFNNNKWAATIEPNYQTFKATKEMTYTHTGSPYLNNQGEAGKANASFKSIELTFGVRHYFFLNDASKLFINANFTIDSPLDSDILLYNFRYTQFQAEHNFVLGAGYNFNNKYHIEIRRNFKRKHNTLADYTLGYDSFDFIIGYNFF